MASSSFKNFLRRIYKRYIIVVYNESNLQERVSISLTPMNLFFIFSILIVLTFAVSGLLFIFTPLRETVTLINKDMEPIDQAEYWALQLRVDSLEHALEIHQELEKSLRKMLNGEVDSQQASIRFDPSVAYRNTVFPVQSAGIFQFTSFQENPPPGKEDITKIKPKNTTELFIPPASGFISRGFSPADDHYAVDIVAGKNAPVKTIKDGHVIFAEWTAATGNVIIIQHDNNLVSVYKHNSVLLKKVGNFVNTGEVIALVGNSGELTSGPHLHFELWQNGVPLDPETFMILN